MAQAHREVEAAEAVAVAAAQEYRTVELQEAEWRVLAEAVRRATRVAVQRGKAELQELPERPR